MTQFGRIIDTGGMGYAQEYHVERCLREITIARIAPVGPHRFMNIAMKLPENY